MKKRILFVLTVCLFTVLLCGQDNAAIIKISKPTVKNSFSVLIQTGETWYHKVTQDSIIVIYERTSTKSKAEICYRKKLSEMQASAFYNMLTGLRIDTLKERYDYIAPMCDDCHSYCLVTISGNMLPKKSISQFNGMHPDIIIVSKQINGLIRKTKYRIRYPKHDIENVTTE